MKILVTGSAGFIGSELCLRLLNKGEKVIGLDNHNNYYDPKIKLARLSRFIKNKNYKHYKIDINDKKKLRKIFEIHKPDYIVNLAAQAGVRYSIKNPEAYINSNILGFFNILENCRFFKIKHLVYASSSSVYGLNSKIPFSEHDSADHPLSVYAATKRSNEILAHSYSHLFNIPSTGLRFFTVYGPWGRPDMALFKFTKSIIMNKEIEVYNFGRHTRDFTYIDDIIDGIIKVLKSPPKYNKNWNSFKSDLATSRAPWKIYNIGNNKPIKLIKYINSIEKVLNKKAKIKFTKIQSGDLKDTNADISELTKKFKYKPKISVYSGVKKFIDWYKNYYQVK